MIERAYIHVAGPTRSGKTTLVEAILRAFDGPAITVRCRCDDDLDESEESAPARDAGLRRYRASVASGAARFDFPAEASICRPPPPPTTISGPPRRPNAPAANPSSAPF